MGTVKVGDKVFVHSSSQNALGIRDQYYGEVVREAGDLFGTRFVDVLMYTGDDTPEGRPRRHEKHTKADDCRVIKQY